MNDSEPKLIIPDDFFDKDPYSRHSVLKDDELRKIVYNKFQAYQKRFGESYRYEDQYILPASICDRELERARSILVQSDPNVMVGTDQLGEGGEIYGLEIEYKDRRFAIPRDKYFKTNGMYLDVNADGYVVSILKEEKWPAWLRAALIGGADMSVDGRAITPKVINALRRVVTHDLVSTTWDIAASLGLGDSVNKSRLDMNAVKRAQEDFGVSNEGELKEILKQTGLIIINTGARTSEEESAPENGKTEIDALLAAIDIVSKRKG